MHQDGNKLSEGQLTLSFTLLCEETEADVSCSFSNVGRVESPWLSSLIQQNRRTKAFGFPLGFNSLNQLDGTSSLHVGSYLVVCSFKVPELLCPSIMFE